LKNPRPVSGTGPSSPGSVPPHCEEVKSRLFPNGFSQIKFE
jgi:hypothetical protein